MEKINFNNGTEPALNAPILNQLQKNIENEFIDSNHFKNLYSGYKQLSNLTYSDGTYTQSSADTRTELQWKIQGFNDDTYVKEIINITNKSIGRLSMSFVKDSSFNSILFGLNGSKLDTKINIDASNLEDGKTYTLSWNLLNNVQGTIAFNEIQIEEGSSMTSYKNYAGYIIESGSNDNGSWIKYSDGTLIQYGKIDKNLFANNDASYSTAAQGIKIYRSSDPWVTFPVAFIDSNNVNIQISIENAGYGTRFQTSRIANIETERMHIQLLGLEDFYNNGLAIQSLTYVHWQAIGKWK